MTLSSRNRLLYTFAVSTVFSIIIFFIFFLFMLFSKKPLSIPDREIIKTSNLLFLLTQNNSYAALASIICLCIYSCVCSFVVFYTFEKTQSSEVIFFTGFLFGCMIEIFRLCIPLFNLWDGCSNFLIYTGKASFAGKLITSLSFLGSSLFSSDDNTQGADRYFLIIITISFLFGSIIPIDSNNILSSINVSYGYNSVFFVIRSIIFIATIITFLLLAKNKNTLNITKVIIGFILFFCGYWILSMESCFLLFFIGILLLLIGTKIYIETIHAYYLWK